MTRYEAAFENATSEALEADIVSNNISSHPARASMGQVLAGRGELVFEGELLEMPLAWHPCGTRH